MLEQQHTRLHMKWDEARSASIQFGGNFIIESRAQLKKALRHLEETTDEDTFNLVIEELDPTGNATDATVLRVLLSQEHGFPEDLREQLFALFNSK